MAAGSLKRSGFGVLPMLVLFVLLLVSLYLLSDATDNSEHFSIQDWHIATLRNPTP